LVHLFTSLDAIGVIHRHGGVILVLDQGVSEAIADTDTGKVDVRAFLVVVALEDAGSDRGSIVAAVRLAEDEELVVGVLGVGFEEGQQEAVHVVSNLYKSRNKRS
jgi:hypothetical protein